MHMRKVLLGVAVLGFALILSLAGCKRGTDAFAPVRLPGAKDAVVAEYRVQEDGDVRTVSAADFERFLNFLQLMSSPEQRQGAGSPADQGSWNNYLDFYLSLLILDARAQAAGTAGPAWSEENFVALKKAFADEEKVSFDQALRSLGLTEEGVRAEIERMNRVQAYFLDLAGQRDLRQEFEKNRDQFVTGTFRLILMLPKEGEAEAETRARVDEVWRKAKAGEDFAALADTYSVDAGNVDPQGKKLGGLYKDFPIALLPESLRTVLLSLEPGQVSDVLADDGKYYIVKLEERRTPTFEEVQPGLVQSEARRMYDAFYAEELPKLVVSRNLPSS
ncbi:MAG: peptidyl-prolyl cis-trans isomerase [Brockia lithotrophica]|nr:peptidyl-prolyl cis-trans isomerase [Brockia lithotrophica]